MIVNSIQCHMIGSNFAVSSKKEEYIAPTIYIQEEDAQRPVSQLISQICKTYTNLDIKWLDPKLIDVESTPNGLNIIYGCLLPLETPIKDSGYWVRHNIESKIIRRIMKEYA